MSNNSIQTNQLQQILQKQVQIQAQLRKYEHNIDIFETYYLQNSWKTGNIYLGWPICSYDDISQFMNRTNLKKSSKPNIIIDQHQKLFSLSSVTSQPYQKVADIGYMATRELEPPYRQKIYKAGRKRKQLHVNNVNNMMNINNINNINKINNTNLNDHKFVQIQKTGQKYKQENKQKVQKQQLSQKKLITNIQVQDSFILLQQQPIIKINQQNEQNKQKEQENQENQVYFIQQQNLEQKRRQCQQFLSQSQSQQSQSQQQSLHINMQDKQLFKVIFKYENQKHQKVIQKL